MSARKNVILPVKIISAGDASGDITGPVTTVQYQDNISFQINVVSGTPTGEIFLQGSMDYIPGGAGSATPLSAGNWISLDLSPTATITAGSPANILINTAMISFPYIRVFYDRGSGTGTLDVWVSSKEI